MGRFNPTSYLSVEEVTEREQRRVSSVNGNTGRVDQGFVNLMTFTV